MVATVQRDKESNNNFTGDKKKQNNTRRRAAYPKKKGETVTNLQDETQCVSRPPLDDITSVDQPSHSISGTCV